MLVLTTLHNICQLLIHVWRQANPATRSRTRDHLISTSSLQSDALPTEL